MIPQSALGNMPYYVTGPLTQTYRMIHVPDDDEDNLFTAAQALPPYTDGFYIVITGAAASVTIAKIDVTYTVQFFPTTAYVPISLMDYAIPGYASDSAIIALLSKYPALQQLSIEQAQRMASIITSCKATDHDQFLNMMDVEITGVLAIKPLGSPIFMNG